MMGGVTWELLFFLRAFFLGFCLRMAYDGFLLLRMVWRHPRFCITIEDLLFWMAGSVMMFGLLFHENNGTPRLFALLGVLAGMMLYHLGPSRVVCGGFGKVLQFVERCRRILQKKVESLLKKLAKKGKIDS